MRLFLFIGTVLCFAACQTKQPEVVVKDKNPLLATLPIAPHKLKGTYTGGFKGSPIAVTLNYITHNHASGYNVHKGLTRNLSGTVEATPAGLRLLLSEPGNNPYDGRFDLLIDTIKWTANGKWQPLKKGDEVTLSLKRQAALTADNNFAIIYTDSLGNSITLKPDGACTYSYLSDTTHTAQVKIISGNYTKEAKTVTFYWQANPVLPQKCVFKQTEVKPDNESDFVERTLTGQGKVFTELWD